MFKLFAFFIITALVYETVHAGQKKTVGARGRLTCNGQPAPADTEVKLWNKKTGKDEVLSDVKVDSFGNFQAQGTSGSMDEPVLKIYHNCANHDKCKRKVPKDIPKSFVAKGQSVKTWYELNLDLAQKQPGEDTKC
ncbi:Transthyretin-like family protein [Aphelenchoides avenae]|nr:Transthyretin-like family protein [Aphelenchus avenae]